jgi:hypothetical protein
MIPRLALALSLLALAAAGCLPAALEDATPDAAVLGVPADALVPGAAGGLDARLRRLETGHDFVAASSLRFLEVRSGLVGSRAVPGAARVARRSGAELAVTIEAATLERELETWGASTYETAELQLEVALIRAEDAAVLARITGPRASGEVRLDGDELPALADDPLIAELTEVGLDELAPVVARELRWLALNGSSVE